MRYIGLLTLMFTLTACHVTKQEILDERKREEGRQQERDRFEAEKPKLGLFEIKSNLTAQITPSKNLSDYKIVFSWPKVDGYWLTMLDDQDFELQRFDMGQVQTEVTYCTSAVRIKINVAVYAGTEKVDEQIIQVNCPFDWQAAGKPTVNLTNEILKHRHHNNIGRLVLEPKSTLIIDESFSELSIQSLRFTQGSKIVLVNRNAETKPLKIKIGTIIGDPHFESYGKDGVPGRSGEQYLREKEPNHPYLLALQRKNAGQWVGAPGHPAQIERIPCPPNMRQSRKDSTPGNETSIRYVNNFKTCGYACVSNPGNGGPGPDGLTGIMGENGTAGIPARDLEIALSAPISKRIVFVTAGGRGGSHGKNADDIAPGAGGPPGENRQNACQAANHGPSGGDPVPLAKLVPASQRSHDSAEAGRAGNIEAKGTVEVSFDRQLLPTHNFKF